MATHSKTMTELINSLSKLPGVGKKTASRFAYHIINMDTEDVNTLSKSIISAKQNMKFCSVCNNISDTDPCSICNSTSRDKSVIMVVAETKDIIAIEKTNEYNGLYHVLGGLISPMEGIMVEDIKIRELITRVGTEDIDEIILATPFSTEGETTAMVIKKLLKPFTKLRVTRIARGVPVGADLEYTDEVTLANAIMSRNEL